MIKVTRKTDESEDNKSLVTDEDILTIIENNRTRTRTLVGVVLTVCGLLLSTSFVVLFFILADTKFNIHWIVSVLLFSASASLFVSIVYSILSALLPVPTAIFSKIELINHLTTIFHKEHRRALIAVGFLLLAILLFTVALGIFGVGLL